MANFVLDLKQQLEVQLSDLTQKIRNVENDLLSLKEAYLKVAGALEVLEVIKTKNDEESREIMSVVGLDD